MQNKLRNFLRDRNPLQAKKAELKDLLHLEREDTEKQVQEPHPSNNYSKVDFKIRKNMEDYRSTLRRTRAGFGNSTNDQMDEIERSDQSSRLRLPSIEHTGANSIRMMMATNSRSVDRSNIFATENSYQSYHSSKSQLPDKFSRTQQNFQILKPKKVVKISRDLVDEVGAERTRVMVDSLTGRTDKRRRIEDFLEKMAKFEHALEDIGEAMGGVFLSSVPIEKKLVQKSNPFSGLVKMVKPGQVLKGLGGTGQATSPVLISKDFKANLKGFQEKVKQGKAEKESRDELRLIGYIKLLFSEEAEENEFLYAVAPKADMPYNLNPVPFNAIDEGTHEIYFTISKERIVKYSREHRVLERIEMEEWLKEKLRFNELKSLDFIRKFRKIKTLNSWKRNNRELKRSYCSKLLELKLPLLDKHLSKPIFEFKSRCYDLQEMNYFFVSEEKNYLLEEITNLQRYTTEYFCSTMEKMDREMNSSIQEIIKHYVTKLWDAAFADLSEDLRSGLAMIDCPGNELYRDDFPLEKSELGFFHKLMTLQIPYRIKSKIKNNCYKVLTLPTLFDYLRYISLIQNYEFNIQKLQAAFQRLKLKNKDKPTIYKPANSKPPSFSKSHSYIMVNLKYNTKYTNAASNFHQVI
jgi:hypothetical protein